MQDDVEVIDIDMGENPDVLDDTHESLIIQGSLDALDGSESYAAKYLAGVLVSQGELSVNAVHGNEAVWQTVKNGFVKSVTYIKNFFKGIWGFFFGKEADAKDEAVNAEVEKEKSILAKLPSTAELADSAKNAIHTATEKASDLGKKIKEKAQAGIDAAKVYAEDKQLKEKLDAALTKLAEITDKGVEAARKQALGIAAAVALRASLWAMYFKEFRGVLSSQVKSLATKTQAEIERLESQIKSAGESGVENLKEKLASLKEVMKSYTSIQQLKSSFRSFITGVIDKLKPSFFKKKEA